MAKKKSETGGASASEKPSTGAAKKPAAAAVPEKKPAAKPAASAAASGSPVIDTSLAANAAAAMIAGKVSGTGGKPAGSQPQKKESAAFKQLKAGLNKPSAGSLGGAFGVAGQQKKNVTQQHGGPRQVGHNQTFGADVTRSGVPRRTPG
jgi:hypothetical protein